ncbi:hypothetical protein PV350_37170 [Streptomyces sp. PA03-6a]|nr:hypothetical protein [Streptomyces sp. PA03-6a]
MTRRCAPRERPDLTTEVRPRLEAVDAALVRAVAAAQPRLTGPRCAAGTRRAMSEEVAAARLDALHRQGLVRALTHACAEPRDAAVAEHAPAAAPSGRPRAAP